MAPDRQSADHTPVTTASPALGTPPQDPESREQLRDPAGRRRRRPSRPPSRRRRLLSTLIAAPLVVVLLWATVSYTVWMLRPTSLSWSVNSVEWVRHNVPFGNWFADHVEQIYYSQQAPKKGGPQLKSLPKIGVNHPGVSAGRCMAAADHPGLPEPASRRRGLAPDGPTDRRWRTDAGSHLSP